MENIFKYITSNINFGTLTRLPATLTTRHIRIIPKGIFFYVYRFWRIANQIWHSINIYYGPHLKLLISASTINVLYCLLSCTTNDMNIEQPDSSDKLLTLYLSLTLEFMTLAFSLSWLLSQILFICFEQFTYKNTVNNTLYIVINHKWSTICSRISFDYEYGSVFVLASWPLVVSCSSGICIRFIPLIKIMIKDFASDEMLRLHCWMKEKLNIDHCAWYKFLQNRFRLMIATDHTLLKAFSKN